MNLIREAQLMVWLCDLLLRLCISQVCIIIATLALHPLVLLDIITCKKDAHTQSKQQKKYSCYLHCWSEEGHVSAGHTISLIIVCNNTGHRIRLQVWPLLHGFLFCINWIALLVGWIKKEKEKKNTTQDDNPFSILGCCCFVPSIVPSITSSHFHLEEIVFPFAFSSSSYSLLACAYAIDDPCPLNNNWSHPLLVKVFKQQ